MEILISNKETQYGNHQKMTAILGFYVEKIKFILFLGKGCSNASNYNHYNS